MSSRVASGDVPPLVLNTRVAQVIRPLMTVEGMVEHAHTVVFDSEGSFALNMLWRRNGWEVRKGFGQVAEMDTTLGAIDPNRPSRKWGYKNHLGSYLMKTDFGHDQVISVFSTDAYTGSTRGSGLE